MTEQEILELIEARKFGQLKRELSELNPADLATILEEVPPRDLPVTFRILPKELAAETFVEMDGDMQVLLINSFSDRELREVLDELFADDAADLIEEMPATVAKRILKQADNETRKTINQLLAYPDDSAGSIMTIEYVDLKKDMTVKEAFARIRKTGPDKETIYTCYVTDAHRKLIGVVTAKDLMLADQDATIESIMEPQAQLISASTLDDKEDVANQFDKYDILALPVVDKENRLVGIITIDDAIDVLQEEMTEDIEKMAAITPSDRPYLKTSVFSIFKARIPWLLLLMVSATFTGMIISSFEAALAAQAVLTMFIPMLMDTGGNSGSQASVTVIRGLSLGEVTFKDTFKVIFKEMRVSILCGIALAAVAFLKIMLLDNALLHAGVSLQVAFVICLTLLLTVFIAKLVGCILPILADKIGFDPAVMASPFITTIVDAISLLIYFQIASVLLGL